MNEKKEASKTQVEVRLIRKGDLESFRAYLKSERKLEKDSVNYLFEKGSNGKIEVYINTVSPSTPEFKKYQNHVMKYANVRTLATYCQLCPVKPAGQIELIKRKELKPFILYVKNYGLSLKAFKYLIEKGSAELVREFFRNCMFFDEYTEEWVISKSFLNVLVKYGQTKYINMYYENASSYEREALAETLLKKSNKKALEQLRMCHIIELKCWAMII